MVLALTVAALAGCSVAEKEVSTEILLSDEGITVDGAAISADETNAVYAAKDIVFYLENQGFTYGEGTEADEHSQEEADAHTVVHISKLKNCINMMEHFILR